jgi:hypothetical protein
MDIDPEDETSYTTQHQLVFLKYVENKSWAKHRHEPVINRNRIPTNNRFTSTIAPSSVQSSHNPHHLSGDDEEFQMPKNVAEMTPGRNNRPARFLTASRLYLNSPPE